MEKGRRHTSNMERSPPDRTTTDPSSLEMAEISSEESLVTLRCCSLDIPRLKPRTFENIIVSQLEPLSEEQCCLLLKGKPDSNTNCRLSTMCCQIVELASSILSDVVARQIFTKMEDQISPDGPSTLSNPYPVTEEDIQASIGNAICLCFVGVLGGEKPLSKFFDKLLQLISVDVKQQLDISLAPIRMPNFLTQSEESEAKPKSYKSHTKEMVDQIIHILRFTAESSDSNKTLASDGSEDSTPDEITEVEEISIKKPATIINNKVVLAEDQGSMASFRTSRLNSDSCSSHNSWSLSSEEEALRQSNTFVTVLFGKLVDHIAESTKTSIMDVDFDGLALVLREKTAGELSSPLPQTVGKIHIAIYKQLCKEFGSAKQLQVAMVSRHMIFTDTLVKVLKAQLQKPKDGKRNWMKKVRRFFARRSNKVGGTCDKSEEPAPQCDHDQEEESTPQMTQKHRTMMIGMFTFIARILRRNPSTTCGLQHD